MRSRSARMLIAAVGAFSVATLVAGCSRGAHVASAPTTLHVAQAGEILTLDPAHWFDSVSQGYMHAIYDTLVQYGPNGSSIEPDLAASWNVTNGGTTYTFTLRKGVKFSNGDPLTATAVQYNIQRMTSKAANAPYAFAYSMIQGFSAWNAGTATGLTGVKVLSPQKVEFDLTAPSGTFLNALALMSAAIGDPKTEARYGLSSYQANAVGTGPYMLKSWVPGQEITLTANPRYWGKKPAIRTISALLNVTPAEQLKKFKSGELDIIGTQTGALDGTTYQDVLGNRSLKGLLHSAPADAVTFLGFNVSQYPFNNLAVRKAVNHILDRAAINSALTGGRAPLDNDGLIAPGLPGYQASAAYPYEPNAATAKQLLLTAGITAAHPVSFELAFQSGDPAVAAAMQTVAQELAPFGLQATLKPVSWTTFFTSAQNAAQTSYGMYLLTWAADYPNPQDYFNNLYAANGQANFSGFESSALQGLLASAAGLPTAESVQDYRQANQILLAQAPAVFLSYGWNDALVQRWVRYSTLGNIGLGPVYAAEFASLSLTAHK